MLSIFIPSYNHVNYVTEAISSALAIPVPGRQVYVIDDASTDNSFAIIRDYLASIDATDVELIAKAENRGAIDSLLTFMDLCRTPYVFMMASDDVAVPEGVAALVSRLEQQPALQFVIGGGQNRLADGRQTPLYGKKHAFLFEAPADKLADRIFLMDPSPLLCQSTVFRTSALNEAAAIDRDIVADDYAIFAKLFRVFNRRGQDYDFCPEIDCVTYRHHGGNSYLGLVRQAVTHTDVIEKVARPAIRAQAVGYKISFLMLVGLRRRLFSIVWELAALARRDTWPWLVSGLFVNFYHWLKFR